MTVLEWLVRLLNVILIWGLHLWTGVEHVLQGVNVAIQEECSNSRGISLLSAVDMLYGKVLIKRGRAVNEFQLSLGRVEDAWTKCLP